MKLSRGKMKYTQKQPNMLPDQEAIKRLRLHLFIYYSYSMKMPLLFSLPKVTTE